MPETVHPGSFVGDSIEEFKKLPTWGKLAVGGVIVVVIFLAIRARNAASTTNSPGMAGTPTTSGTQSLFPMVGNVPVLPAGVNPIYNPTTGDIVGYQPAPVSNPNKPTTTPTTGPVAFPGGTPGGPPVQLPAPPIIKPPTSYVPPTATPHITSAVQVKPVSVSPPTAPQYIAGITPVPQSSRPATFTYWRPTSTGTYAAPVTVTGAVTHHQ